MSDYFSRDIMTGKMRWTSVDLQRVGSECKLRLTDEEGAIEIQLSPVDAYEIAEVLLRHADSRG